ncbi:MAG: hypothetical protein AB1429_02695 [Pseudomonadota bacterium]|jgi:hypothetical protein
MTLIADTAFAPLEREGRLLSPILKGPTHVAGRFGFRGELALKFAPKIADEARPPELAVDQVLAVSDAASGKITFFACYLLSFEYLSTLAEVLSESLTPDGKYFVFCNNIDLLSKYRVEISGITFNVLPIDEAGVYNELLELLYLDRAPLKKMDTAAKQDAIADKAAGFSDAYPLITYEEGLARMAPVRNRNENRPV